MTERFMGEFDPKATYKKGDVVTLKGEAYRRVRDDGGKVDPFETMPYAVWVKKNALSGGLTNLLGSGTPGGTDSSRVVQYTPQEIDPEGQNQARKNMGLYHADSITQKTHAHENPAIYEVMNGVAFITLRFSDPTLEGVTDCTVVIDGTEHKSQVKRVNDLVYIGNGSMLDSSLENTGEEWAIDVAQNKMVPVAKNINSVSVYSTAYEGVHTIDPVWLPAGGSSNAVQYTPQELTEEQQMQARKNLGVYNRKADKLYLCNEQTIVLTYDESRDTSAGYASAVATDEYPEISDYIYVVVNGETYKLARSGEGVPLSLIYGNAFLYSDIHQDTGEDIAFGVYDASVRIKGNVSEISFSAYVETNIEVETIPPEYLPSDIEIIANFDDGTFATSITFEEAWQMSAAELNRRIALYNSEDSKADLQGLSPTSVSKSAIRSIGNHIIIEVAGPYAESGTTYRYGDEPMVLCWSESGVSIMTKAV